VVSSLINNKLILAIIPARGGSKGIHQKNIRNLAGKPLIAWTIESAIESKYIDRTIISSDDDEIIKVAKKWGGDVPFVRPKQLAEDDTPGINVIIHAIEKVPNYDYIMMLQPTSPLRIVEDIDGCIEYCFENHSKTCVSVTEAESNPYWMYKLDKDNIMIPLLKPKKEFYQRQNLPKVYQLNGAVYIAEKNWLVKNKNFITNETLGYIMPQKRSFDIDGEMDFKIIEMVISKPYPQKS
jgi:CMP-N,N'-diacetyllegionaminic acid synthase